MHEQATRVRLLAAAWALMMTLGLGWLLRGHGARVKVALPRAVSTWLLPLPEPRVHALANGTVQSPKRAARRSMPSVSRVPLTRVPSDPAPIGSAARASAPPPLDLGEDALRAAAHGTQGPVARLAEGSGQDLHPLRPSKLAMLGESVQRAGTPGCLRQDALKNVETHAMGVSPAGLATLPFLAAAMVEGKCRF